MFPRYVGSLWQNFSFDVGVIVAFSKLEPRLNFLLLLQFLFCFWFFGCVGFLPFVTFGLHHGFMVLVNLTTLDIFLIFFW